VYLKDLAKTAAPSLVGDGAIDQYVNAGIQRIQGMLVGAGGLSYWPGSGWGYPWSTIYAVHFLVEAKKAGYAVDETILKKLLDHLVAVSNATAFPAYSGAPDYRSQVYALYVLALAGRPNASTTAYAADLMRRSLAGKSTPGFAVSADEETRALLAGALLLAGDRTRGNEFVSTEFTLAKAGRSSDSFWSPTRADAVLLAVLADVDPAHRSIPAIMKALIDRAKVGRWYNTQENAYALMALGKIGRKLGDGDYSGAISVGGKSLQTISSQGPASAAGGDAWVGQEIEVSVKGTGPSFVGVTFEGIRAGKDPEKSNGISVERLFLDKSGKTIDPANVRQGDMVFVRLGVSTPAGLRLENLALVDLLPAGLEIENPRLGADQIQDWMTKNRYVADYVDIRDDRILMFVRYHSSGTQYYYYVARAVTEGQFVLPSFHAEAMYDPQTQGRAGGGMMSIKGRDQ
jgi:alpha-2-macroglobulin